MKRRLEFTRDLLHSPRVLFLDEPTVGLDPQIRSAIWGYINTLHHKEDITIFIGNLRGSLRLQAGSESDPCGGGRERRSTPGRIGVGYSTRHWPHRLL